MYGVEIATFSQTTERSCILGLLLSSARSFCLQVSIFPEFQPFYNYSISIFIFFFLHVNMNWTFFSLETKLFLKRCHLWFKGRHWIYVHLSTSEETDRRKWLTLLGTNLQFSSCFHRYINFSSYFLFRLK